MFGLADLPTFFPFSEGTEFVMLLLVTVELTPLSFSPSLWRLLQLPLLPLLECPFPTEFLGWKMLSFEESWRPLVIPLLEDSWREDLLDPSVEWSALCRFATSGLSLWLVRLGLERYWRMIGLGVCVGELSGLEPDKVLAGTSRVPPWPVVPWSIWLYSSKSRKWKL